MTLRDLISHRSLDVLAYNTYITSYNANMVANEVFIDSATLRENVVALARNIGYIPQFKDCCKTSTISFFVDLTQYNTNTSFNIDSEKRCSVATTSSEFFWVRIDSFTFSIVRRYYSTSC